MDRVKLLCTVYDPAADRYRFDYSIFVAASVGLLCLGGTGGVHRASLARERTGRALCLMRIRACRDRSRKNPAQR